MAITLFEKLWQEHEVTTLSEVPDSNDPEVWNAYLADEGLVNPEFEDDYDDGLDDDMF